MRWLSMSYGTGRVGVSGARRVVYHGLENRMWRDLLSETYPRFADVCRDPATDLWVELETAAKVLLTATPEPNGGRD